MSITHSLLRPFTLVATLAGCCGAPALALAQEPTPPPAPAPTDAPARSSTMTGKGLIAGAGAAAGVAVALNAGRVVWQLRGCRPVGPDVRDRFGGCLVSSFGDVFLSVPAWIANLASIGLAAGGGAVRGPWEARAGRRRNARRAIIAGATMVGVGGTAYIAARLARFAALGCIDRALEHSLDRSFGCYRGVYAGTTIGIQLALSTVAVGAGVLAFGDRYRREHKRLQLQVEPTLSPTSMGLSISGRF
ncbi:MAG: hypothetical protein K1X88_35915 [Nannocystaceae bacterium]|nr:hypothetical protein [Nannocystaceae bacterium]